MQFEDMLKPKDVAQILGCSVNHARELMGSCAMTTVDIAKDANPKHRMLRITPQNLERFIKGGNYEN